MVDVTLVLLGVSFILFFGFFAEFIFKKTRIPDILFLILLGFVLGPYGFNYLDPLKVQNFAPVFTTFALLFLLYDGAFNIDLASFAKGVGKSMGITLFNFFISAIIISGIMFVFTQEILTSILTGFILGGISSAFVIPIIKQLHIRNETYSILTLESAITDVLCIVFALTTLEIIKLNVFQVQVMVSKIASLFAVAGLVGIVAGIVWIILVKHVFKEHKSYMITIAYLLLVYVVTEFLNGNGAIAALFLGIVLRNSRQLILIVKKIIHRNNHPAKNNRETSVTTPAEELFYSQISFFLKTFFFVYIGLLFSFQDTKALLIGGILALALMLSRNLSLVPPRAPAFDRKLMKSIFARGLAAAAIAQIIVLNDISNAVLISNITYTVISFTIILSSIRVFMSSKGNVQKHQI